MQQHARLNLDLFPFLMATDLLSELLHHLHKEIVHFRPMVKI